ncbi:MAG: hypothetical protein ACKOW9_03250 [Candidatus Paceibacterota bacterium]
MSITTKNITVNQIKSIFNDFHVRHPQLNSFYFGEIDEVDKQTYIYPLFAAIPQDVVISEAPNQNRTITHNYSLLFADKVIPSTNNKTEVLSDMLQVAQDYISEVNQSRFYNTNYLTNTSQINITPFTDKFDDVVTGWAMNFTIQAPFLQSTCTNPQTTITDILINSSC